MRARSDMAGEAPSEWPYVLIAALIIWMFDVVAAAVVKESRR